MQGIDNPGLSDAIVILGAAGLVIPLFARFRITPVIGFILVGVAVGPFGLGRLIGQAPWLSYVTITDPEAIEPFAEFGIILLLFSIGLELSWNRLWSMRRLVFGVGAAQLLGCGAVIAIGLFAIGEPAEGAVGLGLALALSSTALVLPIAGTRSPVGRSAFAMLLFEDLAIVPIIFALGVMAPFAGGADWDGFARTVVIGVATVAVLLVAGRFVLPRLFAQAARTKNPELFLAASLLVVIGASLATTAVGLSPILGALIAGILIAETEYQEEVEDITAPFRGLALGVFLISVGMGIDLEFVAREWPRLGLALAAVLTIKAIVTGGLLRLSGARKGTAAEVGVLMASPSETTLIVLAAAAAAGLIALETAQFWEIVTALGLTITPILARIGHDVARDVEHRDQTPPARIEETAEQKTVIIGFGRVGQLVAGMLDRHDQPNIAVEADVDAVASGLRAGHNVLFGDVARPQVLERLGLDNAKAVVLTMDDPVQQLRLTGRLRARYPELPILTRARDADHAARLYVAGASQAVPETLESSLQLSEALLVDLGVAMGPVIASVHERRAEMRAEIREKGGLDHDPRLRRVLRAEPDLD